MGKKINVVVVGAAGRMGRMICQLIGEHLEMCLVGAVEKPGHRLMSEWVQSGDIGLLNDVRISDNLYATLGNADVIIDFSNAESTMATVKTLSTYNLDHRDKRVALIVCATGFNDSQQEQIQSLVMNSTTCVMSSNMSLGINAVLSAVKALAAALPDWDVEIAEIHHVDKKDAPSGTAKMLGRAIAAARKKDFKQVAVFSRSGIIDKRKPEEIGFATIRGGDVAGEHVIYFFGNKERIEIHHQAGDPIIFAKGALAAAQWAIGKPSGLYSMEKDVLGL
jgi:4-hydroxy-tetrahydrodipicolinate reductase